MYVLFSKDEIGYGGDGERPLIDFRDAFKRGK
jgi:hypothetical protein